MPASARPETRLTVDGYMHFPDDGKQHEIIDGEHYVTPSPTMRHQLISGRLYLAMGNFLAAHPELGRVFYAPCDVIFSLYDVVVPDLLVIAADQLQVLTEANVQGAPALVVGDPVAGHAPARRDHQAAPLRSRGRAREVDPARNRIRVYRRGADGSFPLVLDVSRETGGVLTTPALPGFSVEVAAVLAESA